MRGYVILKAMVSGELGGYSAADVVTNSHCAKVTHGAHHQECNGNTAIHYALQSGVDSLIRWGQEKSVHCVMDDACALLREGMPAAVLWKMLPFSVFTQLTDS
eukprot:gene696-919_t